MCIQLMTIELTSCLLVLSLAGTFGFEPASYTVDENIAGDLSVCVELLQGALRDGESVQLDVTVTQGVPLGGDAMG